MTFSLAALMVVLAGAQQGDTSVLRLVNPSVSIVISRVRGGEPGLRATGPVLFDAGRATRVLSAESRTAISPEALVRALDASVVPVSPVEQKLFDCRRPAGASATENCRVRDSAIFVSLTDVRVRADTATLSLTAFATEPLPDGQARVVAISFAVRFLRDSRRWTVLDAIEVGRSVPAVKSGITGGGID